MSDRQLISFLSKYSKPVRDTSVNGHLYRTAFPSQKFSLRETVDWIYRVFQNCGCSFEESEFFVDTPVIKFQYYFKAYGERYEYSVSIVDVYGASPYIIINIDELGIS